MAAGGRTRWLRWLRERLWAGSVVFLALAVVALAAMGGFLAVHVQAQQAEQARRQAVLQAARQAADHLTTLNHNSVEKDVGLILKDATGRFKKQMASRATTFQRVLSKAKVESVGKVRQAGVTSLDGDSAKVLLAVDATVKNAQTPKETVRQYRMSMRLEKHDGKWLVAQMGFAT